MYQILSLLTGIVIAVMVAINGRLTLQYGTFYAAAIIHIVGTAFAFFLCRLRKKRLPIKNPLPVWLYLGE